MYVIFEGVDGSGKSSTVKAVVENLSKVIPDFSAVLTGQPGSTPLGKHIRQLVKYPDKIDSAIQIDAMSRQLLYMVDMINYINVVLKPSLDDGKSVFADRSSFISGMIYGLAEGLQYDQIRSLFSLIDPVRADRCYIMICKPEVSYARMAGSRDSGDHFDSKPKEFLDRVYDLYSNILRGPVEQTLLLQKSVNISDTILIESDGDQESIIEFITKDLLNVYSRRKNRNT
jgi:dTMP kinase